MLPERCTFFCLSCHLQSLRIDTKKAPILKKKMKWVLPLLKPTQTRKKKSLQTFISNLPLSPTDKKVRSALIVLI